MYLYMSKRLSWYLAELLHARGNRARLGLEFLAKGLRFLGRAMTGYAASMWYACLARAMSTAVYEWNGVVLRFKITSGIELKRVRERGQDFVVKQLLGRLKAGDVVYDVGANIGIIALPAARIVADRGLVVAIEPEPANFHRLAENIERNGLNNVVALALAAGAERGTATLYRSARKTGAGAHSLKRSDASMIRGLMVPVARLDDLVSVLRFPFPDYIKIDVEGFELEALQGMAGILADSTLKGVICEIRNWEVVDGEKQLYRPALIHKLLRQYGFVDVARDEREHDYDALFLRGD